MINRILAFCFRNRIAIIALTVFLTAFGYYSWTRIAVEAYPELADVGCQVTTQVQGLAAEEIEQQITTPLERALSSTPGLVSMRSSSTFGLSLITLVFRDGAEDYWERQRVMERIASVPMPAGVTPGLDPVSGPSGEIYRYTLESETKNLLELSEIQRWTVIPALNSIQGVANVDNFGGFTKEFQLELDPAQLLRFGIAVNDVVTGINNNSAIAGGGRVSRGEQSYIVRGVGRVLSLKDIGNILIAQRNGIPILVRDVGRMQFGHQVRQGILAKNNNPDTIEGIVDLLKYENPSRVLKLVHKRVDELNATMAPMGVKIVPFIDRDELVQATVDKVSHTVIEGVGLVCIVLILFLGSPRAALIAAITIPLSLVTAFILMHFAKMPANLFSLGAIDFGVIVDGAIVMIEAILRLREERPTEHLSSSLVISTANHVARPIFFATCIIITAYLPLLAFEHAEGKLFAPMAYTVGFALFGALLCTITLVPGLAYMALRKPRRIPHNRVLTGLHNLYRQSLSALLQRLPLAYLCSAVTLAVVIFMGMTVGQEFLPELDEGSLWLQVQMPTGLSLDKAAEMTAELRRTVNAFPEVSYIVTQTGRNDSGTDPWTPSHTEASVGLKPYSQWANGETKAEFVRKLNAKFKQLPGMDIGISQPIVDGVNDAVGGAHSPLVLRVYGDDLPQMRELAGKIVDLLRLVPGTAQASIFQEPPIPQIVVETNREAAARYGINSSDIMSLVQNAVGGAPVGQVYNDDRIHNIALHLPHAVASDPKQLGNLVLTSSSGAQIPLKLVANIRLQMGESTISHEHSKRQLTIRIDNRDRALSEYLKDAQGRIEKELQFDHSHFSLEWAGQFENAQRAESRLIFVMLLVVAVMAVLLYTQFKTLRHALLILGVVPLAMLGGLIALHVRGETLNIATSVGFIALFGVAVQNGIIMVSNINRVRINNTNLAEAVMAGAAERFRPVLLTATVASVGMLPAALATGVGTDVQRGLATVVVGGLPIATLLTLFILPALYFAIEKRFDKSAGNRSSSEPELLHNDL
ncbi:CusA/CzcA family heavy metal efflux RND transporter [Herbaspirillum sp. RTI4]|uniref:efflux RND transporter permease subunit n=1 Tax=Herbaspirillum sp. RTI4 TaxID=3048640 RepID=UPI002AB4D7DA|nr:CusA/CzcA family heavy metal efflux RND transporter [Herbaspirillum sp. RTI4]MDY7578884.1 CusA/CzcA family heavy metal efflux RND transporter [Herbaspirillum sp. RTI4]MEA9981973.1 CusA/CzcA family heavy metal efflux RND transporter [Herbaspirillum sp. RTI4]